MLEKRLAKLSKFLSLVLRHEPSAAHVELDSGGWVPVPELLRGLESAGRRMTQSELEQVVAENDKRRFVIREGRIRACQGHSVAVDLGLEATPPPPQLYHGTATRFLSLIMSEGLRPMSRQHVHLSRERNTAVNVGARHGKPTVLRVEAGAMHEAGFTFFLSDNGVWLTDRVPPEFLSPY